MTNDDIHALIKIIKMGSMEFEYKDVPISNSPINLEIITSQLAENEYKIDGNQIIVKDSDLFDFFIELFERQMR